MTTERPPAHRVRWLRRSVILVVVLVAAYGLPALWPDVRKAVAGVAEIAPAVLLGALVLETASLACFSGLTVSLLGRARRPRFGTLLRIDVTVVRAESRAARGRGHRWCAAAAAADRGRGEPPGRGVPGDDRGHRLRPRCST